MSIILVDHLGRAAASSSRRLSPASRRTTSCRCRRAGRSPDWPTEQPMSSRRDRAHARGAGASAPPWVGMAVRHAPCDSGLLPIAWCSELPTASQGFHSERYDQAFLVRTGVRNAGYLIFKSHLGGFVDEALTFKHHTLSRCTLCGLAAWIVCPSVAAPSERDDDALNLMPYLSATFCLSLPPLSFVHHTLLMSTDGS